MEECREAFESWGAHRFGYGFDRQHSSLGVYAPDGANISWYAWQAAWNALAESGLVKELVEALSYCVAMFDQGVPEYEWEHIKSNASTALAKASPTGLVVKAVEPAVELSAILSRMHAALDMVHNLCRKRNDPKHREWLMSIPARPDHDPDLIIHDSL